MTVATVLVLGACGGGNADTTVTGLVIDVQGDLSEIDEFTVLVEGGEQLTFVPASDGDFAFELGHLRDHLRSGEPVVVGYEERAGALVAVTIDDG